MVIWFSLETDQEYTLDQLKSFLYKLVNFHVEKLNYHLANAGNQLLVDTDGLRQELAFKTELLKEEFDLAKNSRYKRIVLTHILTIRLPNEIRAHPIHSIYDKLMIKLFKYHSLNIFYRIGVYHGKNWNRRGGIVGTFCGI